MFVRNTISAILFFLLSFQIFGTSARPSFSLAAKRSPSASSVAASLQYRTNAERMAAGLSPRAPTRVVGSGQLVPRNPNPSPISYSGTVKVKNASNNSNLGYIQKGLTGGGRFTISSLSSTAVVVSLSFVSSSSPLQLSINSNTPNWPYIGGAGATLQSNNNNRVSIVGTNSVPSGSTPQNVGNSSGSNGSESYIWKFNPNTNEITAEWVNPNGSTPAVYIYYSSSGANSGLHLSANSNLSGGYTRVRLYLS
ncbi:hypothetical protein CVT24_007064 [Panaeolus cyanescens]|uniref:Uncharacterized protein n=1 Tax=Panaeolus cyanescens TaxID=181874 RepID=A0A409VJT5_9AGAR|nr:hypothetical protein CVT24_007064 [Panaeolus cyanescens]